MPQDDTSVVLLNTTSDECSKKSDFISDIIKEFDRFGDANTLSLLNLGNGERIQIIRSGCGPFAAAIPLGLDGFSRLEAVHRFLALNHSRALPPDTRLTHQQKLRSRRMLQASDGFRDGASQQDIAQVLFNVGRVDRHEWQASSARHAVMSLLRGARKMVAGGYRQILRHHRCR